MESIREWVDDPAIPNDEMLYRGITEHQIAEGMVSSAAFKGSSRSGDPHFSVDRASMTTPRDTLERLCHSVAVAQLQAGSARALAPDVAGIASAPVPGNLAHALILRAPSVGGSAWIRVARSLASACGWAIPPGAVS